MKCVTTLATVRTLKVVWGTGWVALTMVERLQIILSLNVNVGRSHFMFLYNDITQRHFYEDCLTDETKMRPHFTVGLSGATVLKEIKPPFRFSTQLYHTTFPTLCAIRNCRSLKKSHVHFFE